MDRNDAELIRTSLHDPEVFGELFDRHFSFVFHFCARRLDRSLSEDIAGEVFRRAFERRALYDLDRPDARPWLISIALNHMRDTLRSFATQQAAYRRALDSSPPPGRDLDEEVAASLDAKQELLVVSAALDLLPLEEVEVLLLHTWEGFTYIEIADALGIPIGTVRSRLNRVRRRLVTLVDEGSERPPQTPTSQLGACDE